MTSASTPSLTASIIQWPLGLALAALVWAFGFGGHSAIAIPVLALPLGLVIGILFWLVMRRPALSTSVLAGGISGGLITLGTTLVALRFVALDSGAFLIGSFAIGVALGSVSTLGRLRRAAT